MSGDKSVRILFTANINGGIENCGCGDEPAGGLDRIKTFFDDYRGKYPHTLVIDGGDFFNSYAFEKLDLAMLQSLPLLNYNAMALGEQEFTEGITFFEKVASQFKSKFITTNISLNNGRQRRFIRNYTEIKIVGYLSGSVYQFAGPPETLKVNAFPKIQDNDKNSLDILVFHGSRLILEKQKDIINAYDIILLGHDQQLGVWKIGNTSIVGTGGDGEYVTEIIARNSKGNWLIEGHAHKMDGSINSDPQIKKIIQKFKSESQQVPKS